MYVPEGRANRLDFGVVPLKANSDVNGEIRDQATSLPLSHNQYYVNNEARNSFIITPYHIVSHG